MVDSSGTVEFYDYMSHQQGVILVRKIEDKMALCLSVEGSGDIEVLLERVASKKVIGALTKLIHELEGENGLVSTD